MQAGRRKEGIEGLSDLIPSSWEDTGRRGEVKPRYKDIWGAAGLPCKALWNMRLGEDFRTEFMESGIPEKGTKKQNSVLTLNVFLFTGRQVSIWKGQ